MAVNLSDLRKIVYKSVEDIYTPTTDENVRVINMGTNANFDIYVQVGDNNHATFKITDSEIETITGILGTLKYAVINGDDPVNPEDTTSKFLVVKVPENETLRTVINIHSDIGTVKQDNIYPGSLYIGLATVDASTVIAFSELNSSTAVAIYPGGGNYIYENSNAIFNDITSKGDATLTGVTISESLNVTGGTTVIEGDTTIANAVIESGLLQGIRGIAVNDGSDVTFGDQVDFSVGGQGTVVFGNNASFVTNGNVTFNNFIGASGNNTANFTVAIPSYFSQIYTDNIKIDKSVTFPDGSIISSGSDSSLMSNIVRVYGSYSPDKNTAVSSIRRAIIINPFNTVYDTNTGLPDPNFTRYGEEHQAMIEIGRADLSTGGSTGSTLEVSKTLPFLHLDETSIRLATGSAAGESQGVTTISGGSVATGTLVINTATNRWTQQMQGTDLVFTFA